jgi:hypothetical protein
MASTGMPLFFSGQVKNALASPLGICKTKLGFRGKLPKWRRESSGPFENLAFEAWRPGQAPDLSLRGSA